MKLGQIRLFVNDFARSAAFYRDDLELPAAYYEEKLQYALFDTGTTKIELLSGQQMAEVIGEAHLPIGGETPAKFLLDFAVDDVDAAYERLRGRGVDFINAPHDRPDWNARVAHFRDPDGNVIELYKHPL